MNTPNNNKLTPGTAIHDKGKQRVQDILQVAAEIIAFEGHSKFTMRRIADRLGITLRNVQYYFKTKEALFHAVIEQRLTLDIESASRIINKTKLNDKERFLEFVDLSLEENTDPFIRGIQFELWALANHHDYAAKCRDHMTTVYSNFIHDLIAPMIPEQTKKIKREKAVILLAMLQGFPLIDGPGIKIEFELNNLRKLFKEEALRLVYAP